MKPPRPYYEHYARFDNVISQMVEKKPESRITLKEIIFKYSKPRNFQDVMPVNERKIRIKNRQFQLGCTTYGNMMRDGFQIEIIRGFLDADEVAVKRIPEYLWEREGEKKLRSLKHDNVLSFLHADFHDNADIRYVAFELCAGSLDQLFLPEKNAKRYKGPKLPSSDIVLTSLIQGLDHIHSKGLVHGRIKPQNVLISLTQPVMMKWSDFGLIDLKIWSIYLLDVKCYWFAPEIIEEMEECTKSSLLSELMLTPEADIWSAGAVFYYFLTDGKQLNDREISSEYDLSRLFPDNHFARNVIAKMLAFDPKDRIKLVPDAVETLESDLKSCSAFKETAIRDLCSLSEPLESDVENLCQLFNEEGINLNCSSDEGVTPLSLLCSSLEESEEQARSLETLLKVMCERKIEPKGLLDKNSDGFNIIHRLCRNYKADNLQRIIRLIADVDRDALWIKDSDWYDYPLHLLCKSYKDDEHRENFIDIIRAFVESGFDIHAKDGYGNNTLHILCQYKHSYVIETIEMLLEIGISVNFKAKNKNEETLLHKLCRADDPGRCLKDGVQFLAEQGIDVNAKDLSGNTILHWLCYTKYGGNKDLLEIIKLLKRKGVNLNGTDAADDGYTALHLLCIWYRRDNMIDVIRELITADEDIDLNTKTEDGGTALHYLCQNCENRDLVEVIKLFVDTRKVDLLATDVDRKTILHHLCEKYQNSNLVNIVQLLIENGINVNAKDCNGDTAVQYLIEKHPHNDAMNQIIKLFIDNGSESAQVYQRNLLNEDSGISDHPEYHSIVKRRRLQSKNDEIFDGIIISRFDHFPENSSLASQSSSLLINLCNIYGEESAIEIIKECIQRGYDFTANRKIVGSGETAVHHLCKYYRKENLLGILKALFADGGVHVHIKDEDGNSVLHSLCKYYKRDDIYQIIEMLVTHYEADINAKNKHHRTPLYLLCSYCRTHSESFFVDVIRRIIEIIGADPLIKGQGKWTVLHALCQNYKGKNISNIVELLIEKGVDLNARGTGGETALGLLCQYYPHKEELIRTVELFIHKGFSINQNVMNLTNKVPKWFNSKGNLLDCLNENKSGEIHNKERIVALLAKITDEDAVLNENAKNE